MSAPARRSSLRPGESIKAGRSDDERFVRDLRPLGDEAGAEAAYVEFVKKLKPVVWFRMEGKSGDRALHDEMGGPDAKLAWDGSGNPFVKGPVGKSLWLRGSKLKDSAIVPDFAKSKNGKLTVAAWAYCDSFPEFATIAACWNGNPARAPLGQFEFGLNNDRHGGWGVFYFQGDKRSTGLEEKGASFPLYTWQHVAFTTDGETMRLYRQGREVASMKHKGLIYPTPAQSLGVGSKSCDSGDSMKAGDLCWWDGKLDEVAVFNAALTPEEIKKLAAASRH